MYRIAQNTGPIALQCIGDLGLFSPLTLFGSFSRTSTAGKRRFAAVEITSQGLPVVLKDNPRITTTTVPVPAQTARRARTGKGQVSTLSCRDTLSWQWRNRTYQEINQYSQVCASIMAQSDNRDGTRKPNGEPANLQNSQQMAAEMAQV